MSKLYLLVRRCLTVVLVFGALASFAQQTVSGRVTAADDGSGIPGVNILEKGTTNGTVTDFNGNYQISVGANATLVFSFVGYTTQEVSVGGQSVVNVSMLSDVTALSEVVVVGYGSQDKKEITGSVVALNAEQFNKGNVNDPRQLLQGKVPGLSIYNRGGNPNSSATFRLRGISTIGSNSQPLIVIDGVLGASLDNVDPNDIESINVLKDGSAAAIYGSRGSAGVILVTTKRGSKGKSTVDYNGYVATDNVFRRQPVMTASEYIAAGGNDLGAVTDWQDEVTQTGVSNVHNIAIASGTQSTSFRASVNYRNVNGVLRKSGFDQVNVRANLSHSALNNKLKFDFGFSSTDRRSDFSFNEALRYAVLFNPTAPVRFSNGDFYQAVLFDNYNPVAILEQNINEGKRKTINYSARVDYNLVENLTFTVNFARQFENNFNGTYFSKSSFYVGLNRKGLARRFVSDSDFTLFEGWGTYQKEFGKVNLDVTAGYSFQQENYEDLYIEAGGFQNDALGYNQLEQAADFTLGGSRPNVSSTQSPDNRIIAFFGRANLTFDKGIYFNASVRREGSSKLGVNNQWGIFPSFGLGVDLANYVEIPNVNSLKLRAGFGVTGSLPNEAGLAQDLYTFNRNNYTVTFARNANPDLKWEQKEETNIGVDFGVGSKLTGSVDFFVRNIKDFILTRDVDVSVYVSGRRTENVGALRTKGIELALNYNSVNFGDVKWNPGVVLSSNSTELTEFFNTRFVTGEFGSPGQNGTPLNLVEVGKKLGTIWGPVFDRVQIDGINGTVVLKDLNGDGVIKGDAGQALLDDADFKQLGKAFPTLELGWTNQLSYKNWDMNVFFRGAFGHSLINQFRGFYEPIDPGAINSYNRIKTDKAVAGLTEAKYSSLYVEKADFLKLDNITLGYKLNLPNSNSFRNIRFYTTVQNAFMITNYTGIDPEPVFGDPEDSNNPLVTGVDRRSTYFFARTFTLGVNVGF
ncbi:MAG: SusC/RagA family TonB-linked outer membrane protein [Bacteroidetes bacterium CHB5]|nr:SusC/RagA family TonB-linked outer membrane protein [Bacteroidetes bacterium CHB5]